VPPLEVWENRTSEDKWKAVAGAWVRDCAPPPIDETGSVGWKVLVQVFFHGKLVSREETMYGDKTDHFKTASCSLDKGDGNTCNKTRHVFFPEDGGSVILPVVRADDLQPPPIDETGSVGYMVVVAIFSEGQLVSHKSTMYGDNTSNFRVTSCSLDEGDGNTCNKTRYVFFPENGAP
jgi:hypothetical protein